MGKNSLRVMMTLAAFVITLVSVAQQRGPYDRTCEPHPDAKGTLTRQPKRPPMSPEDRQAYLNSHRGGPVHSESLLCTDIIVDGGFETGGIPSIFWNPETSTNFGTPLCDVAGCGTGGGASPPRTGNIWAWFGGIPAPETATLGQTMTIPVGTASLTFWMRIGTVTAPFTDVLNVRIDGTLLQAYPEPAVAEAAYTLRTIDVSAYANGAAHTILFEYIGPSNGTGSYVIDDVQLMSCISTTCTLTCPANITVSSTPGQCGAVVTFPPPTTSGTCGPVTSVPASGSFFPVGTTTVLSTEPGGGACSFTVRVNDVQAPVITCPANMTVNNTAGQCGAIVNFAATATDNCPGVTFAYSPASGSLFPVGTTTVTATATDVGGNTATCTFTIRVNDTENPTFSSSGLFPERLYYKFDGSGTTVPNLATAPPSGTATATLTGVTQGGSGKCGGALNGTGVASQSLNTNWATNLSAPWTISFWLGANQVDMNPSYLFGDINAGAFRCFYGGAALPGNILLRGGSGDVLINGVNPTATLITIVYNGTNTIVYKNGAAPQTFNVTFANVGPGPFRVGGYSTLASVNGAMDEFSLYTRALTATEVLSLFNTCPTNVNSCPANIVVNNAPGTCGAVVTYATPAATDNCPGVVVVRTVGPASGSTFPVGVTTVTHRATDAAGNIANCTFTVTVNDNQAPAITCPGNITVNTPVGSCTAVVPYTVTSSDNCPGVTQTLQSGLASNAVYPIGVTTNTWRATDASGNISTCTFTVTVRDGQLPVITGQPFTKTVCVGTNSDMSITVSNAVSYQWQQWNGTAWVNVTGGTAATLPLNSVTLAMNTNTYRVLVNGLCTNLISNVASLYVNALPTIALTTTKATLTPGETTSITAVVKPAGGTIVWRRNGNVIPGGFTLSGLGIDDIGTYSATYTDPNGCVKTSNDLVINGLTTNNLYVMPNPNDGQFEVRFYATSTGSPLTLTVYSSSGSKVYQQKMTSNQPFSGIDVDLGQAAGGIYMVEVHDADGKKIAARKIIVRTRTR